MSDQPTVRRIGGEALAERLAQAVNKHRRLPVTISMPIVEWLAIAGILQVALRDREFAKRAESSGTAATIFINGLERRLGELEAVFGEVIRAGWR